MKHFSVIKHILPMLQAEFRDVSPVDLYVSMQALARYQAAHRNKRQLPGEPAMDNKALDWEVVTVGL
jgi:hypothetical protein